MKGGKGDKRVCFKIISIKEEQRKKEFLQLFLSPFLEIVKPSAKPPRPCGSAVGKILHKTTVITPQNLVTLNISHSWHGLFNKRLQQHYVNSQRFIFISR